MANEDPPHKTHVRREMFHGEKRAALYIKKLATCPPYSLASGQLDSPDESIDHGTNSLRDCICARLSQVRAANMNVRGVG